MIFSFHSENTIDRESSFLFVSFQVWRKGIDPNCPRAWLDSRLSSGHSVGNQE